MSQLELMLAVYALGFVSSHAGSLVDALKAKLQAKQDTVAFLRAHPAVLKALDEVEDAADEGLKDVVKTESPAVESAVKGALSK